MGDVLIHAAWMFIVWTALTGMKSWVTQAIKAYDRRTAALSTSNNGAGG